MSNDENRRDRLRIALWVAVAALVAAVPPVWPYGFYVYMVSTAGSERDSTFSRLRLRMATGDEPCQRGVFALPSRSRFAKPTPWCLHVRNPGRAAPMVSARDLCSD